MSEFILLSPYGIIVLEGSYCMKFDLSLTITGIIALSAILSPIIVSVINNKYQLKLKKFENYEIARSNALENFLGAWGEHFSYNTHQTEKSFLKALYELIPYFSIDFQLIENIKDCRNDRDSLDISVDKLLTVLSKQIKPTKQSLIKRIFHKLCKRTNHKSS